METPRPQGEAAGAEGAADQDQPIQIDYSGLPEIDQTVWEAYQSRGFCRMRLQPQLLMKVEGAVRAQFAGWRRVYWVVETQRPEEMIAVRDCLALLFRLLKKLKVSEVKANLTLWVSEAETDPNPQVHR